MSHADDSAENLKRSVDEFREGWLDEYVAAKLKNRELTAAYDAALAEIKQLRELLWEVANCGVESAAEPPGLDWYTVQIDIETWDALNEFRDPT